MVIYSMHRSTFYQTLESKNAIYILHRSQGMQQSDMRMSKAGFNIPCNAPVTYLCFMATRAPIPERIVSLGLCLQRGRSKRCSPTVNIARLPCLVRPCIFLAYGKIPFLPKPGLTAPKLFFPGHKCQKDVLVLN